MNQHKSPLAVIILTLNEEANLAGALDSVVAWADQVFVVDSFSTDETLEIAKKCKAHIYQNRWVDWATQRNWALDNLPIHNEWILFLDADERVSPELAREIQEILQAASLEVGGLYIKRKFIFMGRWLRHGGLYPNFVLRLVRKGKLRVHMIGAWEYFKIQGETLQLKNCIIHDDQKPLAHWINKHNQYADKEAKVIYKKNFNIKIEPKGELERKRQIQYRKYVWMKLPLLFRSPFLFFARYVILRGFLDGKEGLVYYFLCCFWYPFLVDAKILEMRAKGVKE